ncbi:MAG: hypothetical protein RI958_1077 [Actinomycetota bacterium]|jgi:hypothetical protein
MTYPAKPGQTWPDLVDRQRGRRETREALLHLPRPSGTGQAGTPGALDLSVTRWCYPDVALDNPIESDLFGWLCGRGEAVAGSGPADTLGSVVTRA